MRIVIKVKKDYDPREIIDLLFKHTNLQVSFSINMVAIAEGKPQTLSLLQIYNYYVNYQREFIVRRTKCELDKAKKREHILTGLVIAVKNIDAVVKLIKNSQSTSEARENLKAKFELTTIQADAILDLRLARLTHLEVNKLEDELKEIRELIKRLTAILGSKKLQMEVVKKELLEIKKTYKQPRKSDLIYSVENYSMSDSSEKEKIDDSVVMLSKRGALKRMSEKNFDRANKEYTDSTSLNDIHPCICKTKSGESVYVFTNLGNCYKVSAEEIPEGKWREKGAPIKEVIKDIQKNETPIYIHSFGEDMGEGNIIFFTKDGLVKKSPLKDYSVNKACFQAIKLKEGDEVISIEREKQNVTMLFITRLGMSLNAEMTDIPVQGRVSGGVKGINLNDGDSCIFASQIEDVGEQIVVTEKGFAKRVIVALLDVMARYRKGVKIIDLKGNNGKELVFTSYVTEPYVVALDTNDGMMFVDSEDISIEARTHVGKALKKGIEVKTAYKYNNKINS